MFSCRLLAVSKTFDRHSITVQDLSTPATEHKAITINVSLFPGKSGFKKVSYLKMNSSLLNHNCVKVGLERLI